MLEFTRHFDQSLLHWKNSPDRKVLLVRGARQVGKTYSIRRLGKVFPYFIEVNFEESPQLDVFFSESLNPEGINEKLSAYYGTPIIPGKTLLFFDEIQNCPHAIKSLRFFYEKCPELHVAAAGSLLEFALEEIPSYGVGRITSLFMYPLSFWEFLTAMGKEAWISQMRPSSTLQPLATPFHQELRDAVKLYLLIGGMPEVVKTYLKNRTLHSALETLDGLIVTLKDDFRKYKKRFPIARLEEVFNSIVFQTGEKFKYSQVGSQGTSTSLKDALELLVKAGIVYKIYHTSAQGLPLGAQVNPKKFKVIFHDVGIHQRLLGFDIPSYLLSNDFSSINKGYITEAFVGTELIKMTSPYQGPHLYYWHREVRGSEAEVDYIVAMKGEIIPIEVKAGVTGNLKSLHAFLNTHGDSKMGVRFSLRNIEKHGSIVCLPLYAVPLLKNVFH